MSDLKTLPAETLEAMKRRLTNWIVYLVAIDIVIVAVFVWLFTSRPASQVLPLVPVLMLPGIAMVPFVNRAAAIRKELERRKTS